MSDKTTSPPKKKRSRARSRREREIAERRTSIVEAARDIFFSRGLYRATVDEIAERAEIAKGTVYLYFSSKETILAHVLMDGLDQLSQEIAAAITDAANEVPEERIRRAADAYFDFFDTHPKYLEMMMASDRGNFRESVDPTSYENMLEHSLRGFRYLIQVLDAGIKSGHFQPGSAERYAAMLWSAVNGVLVLYSHPVRSDMLKNNVRKLYTTVLDAILQSISVPA